MSYGVVYYGQTYYAGFPFYGEVGKPNYVKACIVRAEAQTIDNYAVGCIEVTESKQNFVKASIVRTEEKPNYSKAWIETTDNNTVTQATGKSPSSRGAWIETDLHGFNSTSEARRPPHGGRGLKHRPGQKTTRPPGSPSSRGAWIET